MAASSLLDVNALPAWLRNGQQAQGYANSAGQPAGNNMAAGSLIDMNALPSWLRAVDGQPPAPAAGRSGESVPFGTLPRVESARVPSRPRAEMMPPEQSEAAANVFSSMLGVASNTPYYPAPNSGRQQGFQDTPAQPSGSLYAAQAMSPSASSSMYAPPMSNGEQGMPSGVVGPLSAQGTMPGGYAGNYQNGYQDAQNLYAAYPGGNQGQQMQQPPMAGAQPGAFNGGQGVPMSQSSAKPGKRSFLDTIREWFHL
jgi:hypothetical protein